MVILSLDLVQGPSLVHYDSMRAFPSRLLPLRVQNPDCYKMHSFIVSKTPKVETCEQVYLVRDWNTIPSFCHSGGLLNRNDLKAITNYSQDKCFDLDKMHQESTGNSF